jgi:hypothetical protein
MANNSISLVSLDFDTLKSQLKTYLKSQSQFTDYDFDGSNMSVLLDILTYNTHLNAFYLNMVASEMFMDSAQLRNSVVSIAKALNYTPRSSKSSRATVNLRFAQSNLASFSIPENTRFTGKNSNGTFSFLTNESIVLYPANGFFTANNITLYEGSILTDTFVVNESIENQRYILTNSTIDTDSLRVTVIEDNGQTNTTFTKTEAITNLTANSAVFFLQGAEDSRYEVVFGDNVFGRKPKNGSIVSAQYRITAGERGVGATSFTLNDNLGSYNGYGGAIIPTITTVSSAFGGSSAETTEEIRYRAPRYYQTQSRAITVNDYATLILQEFQDLKNVHVFGGEQTNVPQYGKVFISPVTFTGENLSTVTKREIEDFLKERCTIGIIPEVIDSDYLYLELVISVTFNSLQTTKSAKDIETLVKDAIVDYNINELTNYDISFRMTRLQSVISDADPSIVTSETEVTMKKIVNVPILISTSPSVNYRNEIVPGSFRTSEFASGGKKYIYTDFNPNNNTFVVQQFGDEVIISNSSNAVYLKDVTTPGSEIYVNSGSIDYVNGTVSLNKIIVSDLLGKEGLEMFVKAKNRDITAQSNDVLTIDIETLDLTVVQE